MEFFYIVVLSIAVIILILLLAYFGILMAGAKNKQVYPPSYNTCPDYWSVDASGNCIQGTSNSGANSGISFTDAIKTPGANSSNGFNPNDPGWNSHKGAANQRCGWQKWAVYNGVNWDGVTNYNGC
jgi:hypothetical protein